MQFIIEGIIAILKNPEARAVLIESSREIIKKFGLGATKNFFKNVAAEELKNLSKQEIVALAELQLKQSAKVGFDDAIFTKSNAKKLANVFNQGIDWIDKQSRAYLERKSMRIMTQRYVDTAFAGPVSNLRSIYGLKSPIIQPLKGFRSSQLYRRARGVSSNVLETALFPTTQKQAFASGFFRGAFGQTSVGVLENTLTMLPRGILQSPKYRGFYRSMIGEISLFGSNRVAGVSTASQLARTIKIAGRGAKDLGIGSPYTKETIIGYISGRVSVPVFSTFVFVNKDDRKKKINDFNRSIPAYARKKAEIYVNPYRKRNGTKVNGYTRRVPQAA
jgi:hypothetical protein